MSKYEALDAAIIDSIKRLKNPLYDHIPAGHARAIAMDEGREEFRVLDCRVQALRKAGRIKWLSKKEACAVGCKPGWNVIKEAA